MSEETKLIDDIIQYIEKERELYGDFTPSVQSLQTEKSTPNNTAKNMANSAPKTAASDLKSCQSLVELKTLCAEAPALKTDLEGTRLVFGDGNPDAELVIIGEAPGAEEDKQGKPFVGRAGKMLDKILEAAEFDRNEIYISNILKHRPPGNRNPLPEERQRSLPYLLHQIDLIDPKLILSLGKVSAQTLLNKNGSLKSMRGTFHPFQENRELLATYHPAALLRNPNWKRPTWEDFKMLRKRYDEVT